MNPGKDEQPGKDKKLPSDDELASLMADLNEHIEDLNKGKDVWGYPVNEERQTIETVVLETAAGLTRDEADEKRWKEFRDILLVLVEIDKLLAKEHVDIDALRVQIGELEQIIDKKAQLISRQTTAPILKFLEIIASSTREEDSIKLKSCYHQLMTILTPKTTDPIVQGHIDNPFEEEILNDSMHILNIPACPPKLLDKLYLKYKNGGQITMEDLGDFDKILSAEMNEYGSGDLTEIKIAKMTFLNEKDQEIREKENQPNKIGSKAYRYWENISILGIYKNLLRWKTLGTLLPSAEEKRLPFEFVDQVFKAIQAYEKSKRM